jgi:hypothetical protein
MIRTLFIIVVIGASAVVSSCASSGTIHGYVVDARGRRVSGARVEALKLGLTDQHPPQRSKLLGQTITDSHGNFTLSANAQEVTIVGAEFNHQAGDAPPSFTRNVRIVLYQLPPQPPWLQR